MNQPNPTAAHPSSALELSGEPLTVAQVEAVARRGQPVRLHPKAIDAIRTGRAVVEHAVASGEAVYGLNTGFGSLSRTRIPAEQVAAMQQNLVRSHAAGVGEPLKAEVVRGMMVILAASLCRGRSGVRQAVVDLILELLNRNITPLVPSRGSVGASGDLAPLAHVALSLMGEGSVIFLDKVVPTRLAMLGGDLQPLTLEAKEGLALINGTHLMASIAVLAMADAQRLVDAGVISAALAIDACRGTDRALDDRLHKARNQPGQREVARAMRAAIEGSEIVRSHRENDPRVQDPYCLRCTPQVVGAAWDCLDYVRRVVEAELGAVTDNPLVFAESGEIVSGGNFHGMPLAIAMDSARVALTHVAGIAERRVYWLLAATDPQNPVPAYLSPSPGLHSGLMIAQYTAAACCNELQTLAHPSSVHNVPTSAGVEDYNSMGATSALLLRQSVELATNVIAIELLVMAEAIEHHRPMKSGAIIESAVAEVRKVVPRLTKDRPPAPDIAAIAQLIRSGGIPGSGLH